MAALAVGALLSAAPAAGAAPAVDAAVNWTGQYLAHLGPQAYGLNVASWDPNLMDPAAIRAMKALHIGLLRYPGGSFSDTYDWKTGVDLPSGFNDYARLLHLIHAEGLITVNYGSGTPALAAAWVQYAKKIGAPIAYWEIGNEVYGNGFYGSNWTWETDYHPNHSPQYYGTESQVYINAMRRYGPHLAAGLAFVYPWGAEPPGPNWDQVVLDTVKRHIQFIDIHDYPANSTTSDQELVQMPLAVPSAMQQLKAAMRQILGPGPLPQIIVGELNSNPTNPGAQSLSAANGLFLIENYLEFLANGAVSVAWWDLHNSPQPANVQPGQVVETNYGDYGLLSSGQSPEPPVDTPFLTYWAYRLLAEAVPPGDNLVAADTASPAVFAMGFRNPVNGTRGVVLVNLTPAAPVTVRVTDEGASPPPGGRYLRFDAAGLSAWQHWSGNAVQVPAYGAVAVQFHGPTG
jgi:hypothetical protein